MTLPGRKTSRRPSPGRSRASEVSGACSTIPAVPPPDHSTTTTTRPGRAPSISPCSATSVPFVPPFPIFGQRRRRTNRQQHIGIDQAGHRRTHSFQRLPSGTCWPWQIPGSRTRQRWHPGQHRRPWSHRYRAGRTTRQHLGGQQGHQLRRTAQAVGSDDPHRQAYGEPAEFGRVVAFMMSPANTYLSGQNVLIDGGMVASY